MIVRDLLEALAGRHPLDEVVVEVEALIEGGMGGGCIERRPIVNVRHELREAVIEASDEEAGRV